MVWKGYFDQRYNAVLRFTIARQSDGAVAQFEGIIDTGFSGFIQISIEKANTLGLISPPLKIGSSLIANGTMQLHLLKQAPVTINNEEMREGLIQIPLASGAPVLIGMDLLRKFDRALVVSSKQGIFLLKEEYLKIHRPPEVKLLQPSPQK